MNRMVKLRDKFNETAVITVLENVVEKLISISEQLDSGQFIARSKTHLADLAAKESCQPSEFRESVQAI